MTEKAADKEKKATPSLSQEATKLIARAHQLCQRADHAQQQANFRQAYYHYHQAAKTYAALFRTFTSSDSKPSVYNDWLAEARFCVARAKQLLKHLKQPSPSAIAASRASLEFNSQSNQKIIHNI